MTTSSPEGPAPDNVLPMPGVEKPSAEVVVLDVVTSLDVPVERILNSALKEGLETVVVIGWCKDGEPYFASSVASGAEVMWLLRLSEKRLLEVEV